MLRAHPVTMTLFSLGKNVCQEPPAFATVLKTHPLMNPVIVVSGVAIAVESSSGPGKLLAHIAVIVG